MGAADDKNDLVTGNTRPTSTVATTDSQTAPPPDRKYLLERVDDAAVAQLYADGFDHLPRDQKILIWHLYQAALAGRDIFLDQRYAHNLEMRDVLEEIITHPDGIEPVVLAEIERYTKLFWLNGGPYNNLTARKFVLKCTRGRVCPGCRAGREERRALPLEVRRVARSEADAPPADVLRPRVRPDRHQQDTRPGTRHPGVEREQPLCRCDAWVISTDSSSGIR